LKKINTTEEGKTPSSVLGGKYPPNNPPERQNKDKKAKTIEERKTLSLVHGGKDLRVVTPECIYQESRTIREK